jgi:hypothetical protein
VKKNLKEQNFIKNYVVIIVEMKNKKNGQKNIIKNIFKD